MLFYNCIHLLGIYHLLYPMIKKSIYHTHFSWLKSCFLHSAIKLYIILHHKVELYDRFGQIQSHHERFENNNVGENMFDGKKGLQKLQKSPIAPFTRWFISTRSSFFSSATNHILNWPFSNVKILSEEEEELLAFKMRDFKAKWSHSNRFVMHT